MRRRWTVVIASPVRKRGASQDACHIGACDGVKQLVERSGRKRKASLRVLRIMYANPNLVEIGDAIGDVSSRGVAVQVAALDFGATARLPVFAVLYGPLMQPETLRHTETRLTNSHSSRRASLRA